MMPWVKLDEGFPEHPKVLAVGGDAGWLHVCAIAYCNRNLTDGFVPEVVLARLSDRRRPVDLVRRLVDAGMWESVAGGWRIHDFLEYQASRSKVFDDRQKARDRMARNRGSADSDSANVRANNSVCSPYPSPSPSPLVKTSRQSVHARNGQKPDDDDDFGRTIRILVEHKSALQPLRSRKRWEATTVPNTVDEDGPKIRELLDSGLSPTAAAGQILGSTAAAEIAEMRLT